MDINNSAITPECTALLERVQQAKRLNKLTVETIANAAGMFRPTVQNQLFGRYNLDIRVVLAVARLCPNISCDWLLRGEGDMLLHTEKHSLTTSDNDLRRITEKLQNIENLLHNKNKTIEQT